jgi:hypothetical protein
VFITPQRCHEPVHQPARKRRRGRAHLHGRKSIVVVCSAQEFPFRRYICLRFTATTIQVTAVVSNSIFIRQGKVVNAAHTLPPFRATLSSSAYILTTARDVSLPDIITRTSLHPSHPLWFRSPRALLHYGLAENWAWPRACLRSSPGSQRRSLFISGLHVYVTLMRTSEVQPWAEARALPKGGPHSGSTCTVNERPSCARVYAESMTSSDSAHDVLRLRTKDASKHG